MRRAVSLAAALCAVALPHVARAAATAELAKARAAYQRSNYQACVDLLAPVLGDPRQRSDLSPAEAIDAYRILGLSYFFQAQVAADDAKPALLEAAATQFENLLFIDPDYVLDGAIDGPEAAAYFDQIRRDRQKQLDEIREQRRLDEERKKRPQRERLVTRIERDPGGWPNWVPFGYAQFQNEQPGKGAIFLVLQGATAGTSAYFFLSHAFRYGLPGKLPTDPAEVDTIRTEQVIQISCGAAFFALYAYGVWDGYRHQKPALVTREEIRPIQYDDDAPATPAAPAPSTSSLVPVLTPFLTGDARGLGATWEF
jgi:hypothetical protein